MNSLEKQFNVINPADYAEAAALANEVGEQMLARLEWVTLNPKTILDVGCGVGHCAEQLQSRYPEATIIAVDVAYPMLAYAAKQDKHVITQSVSSRILWTCADAMMLPIPAQSVDLVFANLILPWCADAEKMLREWRRVLCPNGLLVFTSFGPDTLQKWREYLGDITIPNLIDMHEYGDTLTQVKFSDPVMDVDYFTLSYKNVERFLHELQATNMVLSGEHALLLESIREAAQPEGRWNAVYEVIFGHAWGVDESVDHVADEFGTVSIPLAHLRRGVKYR